MARLPDGDEQVLAILAARSEELRGLLHALARAGVAWRRAEPDRAREWLTRLETHPFYKGGQVLFDLLEWEDFLLDGPPPPIDPAALARAVARIASLLGLTPPLAIALGPLPDLEAGFYLYRDVLLGVISLSVPSLLTPGAGQG